VRSAATEIGRKGSVQSQRGPIFVHVDNGEGAGTVEVVHETGGLIDSVTARQEISAVVARVDGEVDEGVDDDDSGSGEERIVDGDVVAARVSLGGELSGGAIRNAAKIDACLLLEVDGLAVAIIVVGKETEVLHAHSGDDGFAENVDLREADGEDGAREVRAPIEDRGDASGATRASQVNQEEVVVQEGSRGESIATEGSREELGNHQTNVDVNGEGTEVSTVGEGGKRGGVSPSPVTAGIEKVDSSAEGQGVDVVTKTGEEVLGPRVQERSGPDKVRDDETKEVVVVSSVRVEATQADGLTIGVLSREPRVPRGVALRDAVVDVSARGNNESVQTTRCVTVVVAHLGDDPRVSRVSVEFIGTTTREIVRRVESGDHVIVQDEEEGIVLVTAVEDNGGRNGDGHEEAQQTTTDDPSLVSRDSDVVRGVTELFAVTTGGDDGGSNNLSNGACATSEINRD
jgi:hypothetical protein